MFRPDVRFGSKSDIAPLCAAQCELIGQGGSKLQSERLISVIWFADSICMVRPGTRTVARASRNHPAFAPSSDSSNLPKARDRVPKCDPQRANQGPARLPCHL